MIDSKAKAEKLQDDPEKSCGTRYYGNAQKRMGAYWKDKSHLKEHPMSKMKSYEQ